MQCANEKQTFAVDNNVRNTELNDKVRGADSEKNKIHIDYRKQTGPRGILAPGPPSKQTSKIDS